MVQQEVWLIQSSTVAGASAGDTVTLARDGDILRLSRQTGETIAIWSARDLRMGSAGGNLAIEHKSAGWALVLESHGSSEVERLSASLEDQSRSWTATTILRQYKNDATGKALFQGEVDIFGQHGYVPMAPSVDGGHVHVGRLLLTGGWSVLAGKSGIRSDGTITVTFQKAVDTSSAPAVSTPPKAATVEERLAKAKELRDAGHIDEDEYRTQRARILDEL